MRWGQVRDGIEPIVGFRMWFYTLTASEAHLHPASRREESRPSPWDGAESGWVVSACTREGTDPAHAPAEECTCGFHAMNSLEGILALDLELPEQDGVRSGVILGRVELAGKIIEHDFGYRAEVARIVELFPIRGHEADAGCIARLLGLPLGPPVPGRQPSRPPRLPPRGPSTLRLRVRHWVRDVAA
jgi:hypothetical protein